jgi:hypothetical protein
MYIEDCAINVNHVQTVARGKNRGLGLADPL